MIETVVVQICESKELVYLSSNNLNLKKNNIIVLDYNGSSCLARVIDECFKVNKKNVDLPLNKVMRVATEKDLKEAEKNRKLSENALSDAQKISKELDLPMNFVEAYYSLDKNQLFFSFLADDRIDFRELAKKLAQKYKTRIELRQIGVRDKAKKIGGLGPCGLFLCCNTFLTDFNSVSINMAKNQFLALNPTKINGVCGRLLCCLGYENDTYTELKKSLPKLGAIVETQYGVGKVVSVDVFQKKYGVDLKEKGIIDIYEDVQND